MFGVVSLILTGLFALAVGVGVGLFIGRNSGSAQNQKDLEQSLNSTKEELDTYQQDVAKHFMQTAQKINELTQSYRDLNQHLADGAMRLTSAEITQNMIAASDNRLENKPMDLSHAEPPKDWAPKVPGRHGMLSEEFGLKDHDGDEAETDQPKEPQKAEKKTEPKDQQT